MVIALATGIWIFGVVLIVLGVGVAFGLYSLSGSAINRHPYHQAASGAPGSFLPDEMSDFETFEEQYLRLGPRPRRRRR